VDVRSSERFGLPARNGPLAAFNLRHQFRPRWYGELAACCNVRTRWTDAVEFNERDYYQAALLTGYQMTRAWVIELAYSYTYQDYEDTPGDAQANDVFLTVNYQPRGRVWSW
jgi:hypothetical protein